MNKRYPKNYFNRGTAEQSFYDNHMLRPDQYQAMCYAFGFDPQSKYLKRKPKRLVSVGCGQGFLENAFVEAGVKVVGIDTNNFLAFDSFKFTLGGMEKIPERFDTLLFCEAIEHITKEEFDKNWPETFRKLRKNNALLIIVNWKDYHPIYPDESGWDHVRVVDDAFYDELIQDAANVWVRDGSHLVLEFREGVI